MRLVRGTRVAERLVRGDRIFASKASQIVATLSGRHPSSKQARVGHVGGKDLQS